jgi:hypothetical protein
MTEVYSDDPNEKTKLILEKRKKVNKLKLNLLDRLGWIPPTPYDHAHNLESVEVPPKLASLCSL